jgi:pentapeptide MXKDX repeat protein
MNTISTTLIAVCIATGSVCASAAEPMKGDGMAKGSMAHDAMNKDMPASGAMAHDGMKKGEMKKDAMKKDAMGKDAMGKDGDAMKK